MSRIEILFSYHDEDPTDDFVIFAIAKEYEKLEQFEKSEKWYLNLREKSSDYIGLYYNLGKLYEKMEKFSEALSIYSEGLVVAKNISDFHAASELNSAKMNLEIEMDE